MYLHVLEHIEDDKNELNEVFKKLKSNGVLIIMVPQHQSLYSNFDKYVGHFRRYEMEFFTPNLINLKREKTSLIRLFRILALFFK